MASFVAISCWCGDNRRRGIEYSQWDGKNWGGDEQCDVQDAKISG